jgi:hypothetical protein
VSLQDENECCSSFVIRILLPALGSVRLGPGAGGGSGLLLVFSNRESLDGPFPISGRDAPYGSRELPDPGAITPRKIALTAEWKRRSSLGKLKPSRIADLQLPAGPLDRSSSGRGEIAKKSLLKCSRCAREAFLADFVGAREISRRGCPLVRRK